MPPHLIGHIDGGIKTGVDLGTPTCQTIYPLKISANGVENRSILFPRVGVARQPWSLLWNPFGVHSEGAFQRLIRALSFLRGGNPLAAEPGSRQLSGLTDISST